MKLLERYILRQFIQTAFFSLIAFTLIFIVVDMMENLDDFLDRNATIGIISLYYFYFIPEIIKLIIPVAMLMSALFTTGRLSTFNELTASKSCGMSLYQLMIPLLVFSLFITGISIYFNGWLVPYANKKKFEIGRVYFQKSIQYFSRNNLFIQDSETSILTIGVFDDEKFQAHNVSLQEFDQADITKLVARLDAVKMEWDSKTQTWNFIKGTKRQFTDLGEQLFEFDTLKLISLHFTPYDIRRKREKPDEMNYSDLKQFIKNQQRAGQDVSRWQVDFYSKISFPFASFIVVLFGVPFSSIKRRSGLGVEFGIAIAVCFLYMIFLKISQAFGYNGDIHPLLTAWLANIIFLIVGLYNLLRVPK